MDEDQSLMIGGLLRIPLEYVAQRIIDRLKGSGFGDMNNTNFFVFAHLRNSQGIRLVELARKMNMSKQSTLYLVNHLVDKGYVERKPDETDRRAQILCLTPLGRQVLQTARQVMSEIDDEFARLVGRNQLDEMKHTLLRLVHAIEQDK